MVSPRPEGWEEGPPRPGVTPQFRLHRGGQASAPCSALFPLLEHDSQCLWSGGTHSLTRGRGHGVCVLALRGSPSPKTLTGADTITTRQRPTLGSVAAQQAHLSRL